MLISLVVTVIGDDRPGIVNSLSDVAQRFGANWAESRMTNLAGQFAGIVHFEVSDREAEPLASALRGLSSSGLQVVIAKGDSSRAPGSRRSIMLNLVGHDRPGIVRELSASLARRGVSIEELHTEIASAAMSAERLFTIKALLQVPEDLPNEALRLELEALANEMMVDIDVKVRANGLASQGA
jgi:methionyl-tRNA formyltransferase